MTLRIGLYAVPAFHPQWRTDQVWVVCLSPPMSGAAFCCRVDRVIDRITYMEKRIDWISRWERGRRA